MGRYTSIAYRQSESSVASPIAIQRSEFLGWRNTSTGIASASEFSLFSVSESDSLFVLRQTQKLPRGRRPPLP